MEIIRRIPRSLFVLLIAAVLLISPGETEAKDASTAQGAEPFAATRAIPVEQFASDAAATIDAAGIANSGEGESADGNADGEGSGQDAGADTNQNGFPSSSSLSNFAIPAYEGSPYAVVNGNAPFYDKALIARAEKGSFEEYSSLDNLGRAVGALACASPDTMPEGERGSIGHIRPSGFSLARYDWVDGKYLFNRCHLIGWQITGENDNVKNLVTGTRHMNVDGMLPFEDKVASYIERTGNHVLYRATPVYEGNELVCRGVLLEARSIEDAGADLSFCVFCFNVQPGVSINYATGASQADGTMAEEDLVDESQFAYILNTNTKKIHKPDCPSVDDMKEKNKRGFNGTVAEAEAQGYTPCGRCKP